jgi:predicted AlkP superfamily phosphohydrolase/phosphomutase
MRQVNLNTWLLEKGYIRLRIDVDSAKEREKAKDFKYVDWKNTKAYALGLNGIYVNLKDREKEGSVRPEEKEEVLRSLSRDLLEFRDPGSPEDPYDMDSPGKRVISGVFLSDQVYHGDHAKDGPDLIVGYARGYRVSKASPLGDFPEGVVSDNTDAWSGDHCIDPQWVPGVFFTNKQIAIENPALTDLAGIILSEFGITEDPDIPISKDPLLVGDPAAFANRELPPDKVKPDLLRSHAYLENEE